MKTSLTLIAGSAVALLASSPLRAQDTWNSATGTVWTTGSNWLGGSVPASTDTVTLDKSNVTLPGTITLTTGNTPITITTGALNFGSSNGPALTGLTLSASTSGTTTVTNTLTLSTGSITMDSSLMGGVSITNSTSAGQLDLTTTASGFSFTNNSSSQALTIAAILGTAADGKNLSLNSSGGAIILSGANVSTGAATVGSGSNNTLVQLGSTTALSTFSGVTVNNGSVVDLNGQGTLGATNFTLNGAGFGSGIDNGALVNSTGTATDSGTVTLASNATIKNSGTGSLTLTGPVNIGTNTLTVDGTGTTTISGIIGGTTGGLTKIGTNTLQLTGASVNTYTGTTTINGGTLVENLSNLSTPTNLISSSSALVLGGNTGGTLQVNGKSGVSTSSQTFSSTTVNAGANAVTGSGTVTIALGAITRNTGGTLNFTLPTTPGVISTSSSNDASGILGAWAVIGNSNYATVTAGNMATYAGATAATAGNVTSATTNYKLAAALTLSGASTGNTLQYTGAAATLAEASNSLALNGLMNSGSGVLTISGGTLAAGSLGDLILTGTNGVTITSGITSGNLVDSNTNTVTISGVNTYAGATYVNSGVLNLNSSVTGTGVFVANGATLTEGASAVIGGTAPLTIGQSSTVTLNGANTYTGTTTLGNASTLNINNATAIGSGTLVINGGTINNTSGGAVTESNNPVEIWNNNFTFTGGSNLNLGTGAVTLGQTDTLTVSSNTLTVGGAIGGNFGLTKAGNGVLVLNGNNTYTGLTTASAGTLTLTGSNSGADGTKLAGAVLNIGNMNALGSGTLYLNSGSFDNTSGSSGTLTGNNNIDLGGSVTFVGSNNLDVGTGSISLVSSSTLTVNANTLEFDGGFQTTGTLNLTKNGVGTLLLTGGSPSIIAYQGSTTVNSGTLEITGGLDTNAGTTTVNSGATLDLSNALGTVALTESGTLTINNGGILLLDNRNGNEGNNGSQLANGVPLLLNNGSHFIYQGSNSGDNSNQTISTLALGAGISTITVTDNNSGSGFAKVTFGGPTSGGAGTALINGVNLGVGALGSTTSPYVVFSSTPGTIGTTAGTSAINATKQNTAIVPFLLGESGTATGANGTATGTANTFLTYASGTGFRPLNPTDEFMNNSIVSGDNTYIKTATAATGSTSINSLVLNGGNLNIGSTATLTNASGALLFVTNNSINGGTYNLGGTATTATYNAFITTDAGVNTSINSNIIQTGTATNVTNLYVYGYSGSSLDLTGSNSYTGATTVTAGSTLLIGNNNALGASFINSASGTIAADNQARTIGNTLVDNTTPDTIGGSSALTFTGSVANASIATSTVTPTQVAFTDSNFANNQIIFTNTAPTTFSGVFSMLNATSGHNNSGGFINLQQSTDVVISGAIQDNNTGNSSGDSNALTAQWSGAIGNLTIGTPGVNSTNAYGNGVSGSFQLAGAPSNPGFYTLSIAGGTPFGFSGLGSNSGDVILVALTNGETLTNGFTATGGSINNQNFGLGFAGSNSMTITGAWGNTVNFLDIAAPTATLTFSGNSVSAGLNWAGPGNLNFASSETMTGANFIHNGSGIVTISGTNSMTGSMTLNGGTTVLDYSTNDNTKLAQNTVANGSAAALTLQGVNVQLSGGSGATYQQTLGTVTGTFTGLNGTTLAYGQTSVSDTNSGTTMLQLGALTRNTGGAINFGTGAGATTTADTAGILGGWATFGGTDWAVANGGTSAITAYSGYTTWPGGATGSSTANYLISAGGASSTTGNFAANTVKFSTASGTLSLASTSTLTVTSGGLLFTGSSNYGIASGTLTTGASDLVVNQYSTGSVTIGSVIAGSEALTVAGGGTLALTGANSYTGGTFLDGSEVQINADNNLGGAGSITMQGGTLDVTTAGFTSARSIVLGVDGGTVEVDSGTLTESGVISGGSNATPTAFTKTGAGTLALSGNNTLFSQVNINAGTLMMGAAGTPDNTALGASSTGSNRSDAPVNVNTGTLDINGSTAALGVLTLNGGAIIDSATTKGTLAAYSFNLESGTVGAALVDDVLTGFTTGPTDLYKFTNGTVVLTGNNTYSGATQISGGVLQVGNGGTTGSLGTANVTTSGALPVGVTVTAGSGTIAFDRSDSISVANAISGTGGVTQMGSGTLTLTGSNSYSGTTAINNGTLAVGTISTLSASTVQPLGNTSGITLGVASTSSGVLRYTGTTTTLGASITALGNGGDTVQNAGTGTLTLSGSIVKNGTTLTLNAGTGINVTGVISGTAANSDMDFTGGTTTLSTAATYNGPTWIYGGGDVVAAVVNALPTTTSLNLGTSGANGAATTSTTTAATFDVDGNNQSVASLNTEGTGPYTSDIVTNGGVGSATLTVTNGGTFAGIIQNGTGTTSFSSSGGTMTLSGANTYTGATTVSSGTLIVSGSTASGSAVSVTGGQLTAIGTVGGTVNVASGAFLNGTGTTGVATVQGGGTINLANGTVGTLTVGGLTIGGTTTQSALTFDIGSSLGSIDMINDTGALTLNGTGTNFGTTISIGNATGVSSLATGTYTLIGYGGAYTGGLSDLDLLTTGLDGDTFQLLQGANSIELVVTTSTTAAQAYFNGLGSDLATAGNFYTTAGGNTVISSAPASTTDVFLTSNSSSTTGGSVNSPTLNSALTINSLTFTGSGTPATAGENLTGTGTLTIMAATTTGAGGTNTAPNGITAQTGAGNNTIGVAVALGASQTWSVTDATNTLTVSGQVSDGGSNYGLTKSGAGVLALSGSNIYGGGTTVSAGTLLVSNTTAGGSATGSGALAVGAGATIGGYGTSSGTSFSLSGTGTATGTRANVLVGMNSASDTNTTQSLTLKGTAASTIQNANLTFNINAGSVGQGTELNVGSTLITFGAGVQSTTLSLNLQGAGIIAPNSGYVLIAGLTTGGVDQYTGLNLGTSTVNGNVTITQILGGGVGGNGNLTLALTGLANTYYGANSYLVLYQNSVSGADDIEVEVVPEPGTWAMMIGGVAMLVFWQRRRRNHKL